MTFGTLFGVCCNPIAGFTVVVALLLPSSEPFAFDGLVPGLTALKTE
jgi:hypothetical protein